MENAASRASQDRLSAIDFELLGEVQIPTGTTFSDPDSPNSQTEIGGLSGLAYDAVSGLYYALADDRSSEARFYTVDIDLSDGVLNSDDVALQDVTFLLDKDGDRFESGSLDPEGIALTPDGTLYVSSEGDAGDDQIWGDDSDDLIRRGLGNNTLTGDNFSGGQGADTFVLAIGEGTDTITDFEIGTDFIGLADDLTFGSLSLTTQGNNTLITAGDKTLATVLGASSLSESAFVTV